MSDYSEYYERYKPEDELFHHGIASAISIRFPLTAEQILNAYKLVGSWDQVVEIAEESVKRSIDPITFIHGFRRSARKERGWIDVRHLQKGLEERK